MRLIDADQLCEDLLNRWSIADTRKEELIRQVMADVVTPIVVSQPTIEPQTEVIRCKDCKHWFNAPVNDEYNSCEEDALIRHKDFFCANGELRGDSE